MIYNLNKKIGKERNSYREEISRQKVHTNTRKLNWNFSIRFSLYPLHSSPHPVSHPLWWHFSKTLMWHHLYRVFTYIYSLLIKKEICDRQNLSVKLPCVCVCLLFGDLLIFSVWVFSLFSYFLCYSYFGTFFSM